MKTIWTFFLALFISANLATAQDTLYVYKAGAVLYKQAVTGVDSLTFKKIYPMTVTDIDGNVYKTVTIGTQIWMAENLKVTHFRDGTTIPNVTNASTWANLTTGAWCDYNNVLSNGTTYGHLYNWYAVTDSKNIAPIGWHVAIESDWNTLSLNVLSPAELKESGIVHWQTPNTGGTNSVGFTALPGGYFTGSSFIYLYQDACFWLGNASAISTGRGVALYYNNSPTTGDMLSWPKARGLSVRCVKD
jgi:uncharacterized protein (TIGR02145 family)